MTKRRKPVFTPHEHLEFWVTKTTYAQRLQWLEEANEFVRKLKKNKNYPRWPKK